MGNEAIRTSRGPTRWALGALITYAVLGPLLFGTAAVFIVGTRTWVPLILALLLSLGTGALLVLGIVRGWRRFLIVFFGVNVGLGILSLLTGSGGGNTHVLVDPTVGLAALLWLLGGGLSVSAFRWPRAEKWIVAALVATVLVEIGIDLSGTVSLAYRDLFWEQHWLRYATK